MPALHSKQISYANAIGRMGLPLTLIPELCVPVPVTCMISSDLVGSLQNEAAVAGKAMSTSKD